MNITEKTEELLVPAIRQYMHNDGEGGFVIGYDKEETEKVVGELLNLTEVLKESLRIVLEVV